MFVNFIFLSFSIFIFLAVLMRFSQRFEKRERHLQQMLLEERQQQRIQFDEYQIKALTLIQESMQKSVFATQQQVNESLNNYALLIAKQIEKLTAEIDQRLKEINGQVEKRLAEGFEKTTATFTDIVKRLALIDEAQKKITELSTNVVSLQHILADKRSRGAFGEVQLAALIRNMIPETHFALQYTLSNEKRADCILFLPEPTGNIVIDAKFPLENYRQLTEEVLSDAERQAKEQLFKQAIRKHIQDIAQKYILPNETAEGAMMFIPAEAIFAEIHAHHCEIVEYAHKVRVWMVSPTTLMAILTTARAVIKDAATRKQIHIIQEHLTALAKDFERFQKRMDAVSEHIKKAQFDVEQVHISSRKITQRFQKIEQVELHKEEENLLQEEIME